MNTRSTTPRLLVARPKLYMRRYGESTGVGPRENMFPSVRAAVEAMLAREGRTDGIAAEEVPDGSFRAFSIISGPVSNRRTQVPEADAGGRRST